MDWRKAIAASYYAQRGGGVSGAQPVLHGSLGMSYQGNYGVGTTIGPPLPAEPSSVVSPHSVNVETPTVVPVGQAEPVKRKRGLPRKYGPDGSVSRALSSASISPSVGSMQRRGRGRPPGSGRKLQIVSLGSSQTDMAGVGFTPHIITIAVGEDVTLKIMSFAQQCSIAVCILSATGSVSTVTLRQSSSSGSTVTYEGRFEILCSSDLETESEVLVSPLQAQMVASLAALSWDYSLPQHLFSNWQFFLGKFKVEEQETGGSNSNRLKRSGDSTVESDIDSTVPVSLWPDDSQPVDIDDVHDIDLMLG